MLKAYYETKYGNFYIEYEGEFLTKFKRETVVIESNEKNYFTDEVIRQVNEYFEGQRKKFDIKTRLYGTEFQSKVWEAISDIEYGTTRSYQEVSSMINSKNAQRAVGGALNKNPVAIIIPCHRIIGKNKKLVGYEGGLEMKEELLELEKRCKNTRLHNKKTIDTI